VLGLAATIAKSRVEIAEHKQDVAIATLTEAVAQEDRLSYDEPADWFFPVRHLLGAELLEAGQNAQARAVYVEDLRRNPDNGWSLFGLARALRAERKPREAAKVDARFAKAWGHADFPLTASAM
jgi:tetratricopeptide (TPR) repeat protein